MTRSVRIEPRHGDVTSTTRDRASPTTLVCSIHRVAERGRSPPAVVGELPSSPGGGSRVPETNAPSPVPRVARSLFDEPAPDDPGAAVPVAVDTDGRGAHGGHLRRARPAHPAPPVPEPAGRPAPARRPDGRAHRAGRGHARGVHDVVRAARPADRPRPADERDHRRLVVRVADRGHRAEPRVPQGWPGQDRRRQGRPEGHRRGGARDGRRCAGAARARAAAGPARLAAGRADPAGQRHHRHGCAEHDEPGGGDPRRDAGPGERDRSTPTSRRWTGRRSSSTSTRTRATTSRTSWTRPRARARRPAAPPRARRSTPRACCRGSWGSPTPTATVTTTPRRSARRSSRPR